jgi:hypothetical protein
LRGQGGRLAARAADLPATPQGSVNLDQAQRDFPARLGQRVLHLHQGLLELSEPREIDGSRLELPQADLDGLLGVGLARGQGLRALLTEAVNTRSLRKMMRDSISSAGMPVYCQTTLTTGMSMLGKMSVDLR